jgi:hypothetical protein
MVCTVEMPAHPAPAHERAAPRIKDLKIELTFTNISLGFLYGLGNFIIGPQFVGEDLTPLKRP